MAQNIDLYMDQGADFSATLTVTQTPTPGSSPYTSIPFDLTGYSVSCLIRRSYYSHTASQLTAVISDHTNGVIVLSLTSTQTAAIFPARWVYDVNITDANGIVSRVFEGLLTVNPGVSNQPHTVLISPVGEELTKYY